MRKVLKKLELSKQCADLFRQRRRKVEVHYSGALNKVAVDYGPLQHHCGSGQRSE